MVDIAIIDDLANGGRGFGNIFRGTDEILRTAKPNPATVADDIATAAMADELLNSGKVGEEIFAKTGEELTETTGSFFDNLTNNISDFTESMGESLSDGFSGFVDSLADIV